MNPQPSPAGRSASPKSPRPAVPKLRLKKILVPVDFSQAGKPSLSYARFLARQTGASLLLVHVIEPVNYQPDFHYILPDLPETREHINRELGALQVGQFRGIKTLSEIRNGQAFQQIVRAANEGKADLIVMATHGHTGLQHILLGSTAERVVRHAECPVLVVRSQPSVPQPRKPSARRRKAL